MSGTPVAAQSTPSEPFLSYCLCLVRCRAVTGSILKLDQFIMCQGNNSESHEYIKQQINNLIEFSIQIDAISKFQIEV